MTRRERSGTRIDSPTDPDTHPGGPGAPAPGSSRAGRRRGSIRPGIPLPAFSLALALLGPGPVPARDGLDLSERVTAVALLDEGLSDVAAPRLEALVAGDVRFAFDWINLALARLQRREDPAALRALEVAARLSPRHPRVPYLRGVALRRLRRGDEALRWFEEALVRDPACLEARYHTGRIHAEASRVGEAIGAFTEVLERTGTLAPTGDRRRDRLRFLAHKHLSILAAQRGDEGEADRHRRSARTLGPGAAALDDDVEQGPCSQPVDPTSGIAADEIRQAGFEVRVASVPPLVLETGVWPGPGSVPPADLTVTGWGPTGPSRLWSGSGDLVPADGAWVPTGVWCDSRPLASGDLGGPEGPEVIVPGAAGSVAILPVESWVGAGPGAGHVDGVGPVDAAVLLDHDHDGDLDLVLAGTRDGAPALIATENRTDPAIRSIELAPVSHERCGLTTGLPGPALALLPGDLDSGNEIDLVVVMRGRPPLALLSRRQGRFERIELGPPAASAAGVLVDLEGDGSLELVHPIDGGVAIRSSARPGVLDRVRVVKLPGVATLAAGDLDGDLAPDIVARTEGGGVTLIMSSESDRPSPAPRVLLAGKPSRLPDSRSPGSETEMRAPGASLVGSPVPANEPPMLMDLDHSGSLDLVLPGQGVLFNRSAAAAGSIRISLEPTGGMSAPGGIGSRLWVRAGGRRSYREIRHPWELVHLGGASRADLVRVQWSNGVVQNHFERTGGEPRTTVSSGTTLTIRQRAGLSGSCPYLYRYEGEGEGEGEALVFVTDVLAGSPLGLPGPDGLEVPANPVELVAIPAPADPDEPVRLRITEEYREVTYLDRVRLWVVDHAPERTVLPVSGIGAPAEVGIRSFETLHGPRWVTDGAGRPITGRLFRADGVSFEPPATSIQGLAPLHRLEMEFEPVPADRRIHLVLEGFVYWTDAGINTRLSQCCPGALAGPWVERLAPAGAGVPVRVPVRFPAGRTKTSMTEVTDVLDRDRPRIRLTTSMRLYLDRVALAVEAPPGGEPAVERRNLERAVVVHHGIRALGPDPGRPPWTVDAGRLTGPLESSWIVPDGHYTAYGPATGLLEQLDDQLVIIGPGDGVDIRFPPAGAPGPGTVRSLFLEVAGSCKDAHPATRTSATVDPLPRRVAAPGRAAAGGSEAVRTTTFSADHPRATRYRSGWGGTRP